MKALLFVLLLALAGNAYGGKVSTTTDRFDGATRIEADPYGTECGWSDLCPMIGARWVSSASRENAVLIVKFIGDYTSIRGIKFNIDGQIVELSAFEPLTKFSSVGGTDTIPGIMRGVPGIRTSIRDFKVPLSVIDQMLAAHRVTVRVETDKGLVDSIFSGGERRATGAYKTLKEFSEAVAARREAQPQAQPGQAQPPPIPSNGSTPPGPANNWWNQQRPAPAAPAPTRYRCTDADGKPYVVTTPTSGCVVES